MPPEKVENFYEKSKKKYARFRPRASPTSMPRFCSSRSIILVGSRKNLFYYFIHMSSSIEEEPQCRANEKIHFFYIIVVLRICFILEIYSLEIVVIK